MESFNALFACKTFAAVRSTGASRNSLGDLSVFSGRSSFHFAALPMKANRKKSGKRRARNDQTKKRHERAKKSRQPQARIQKTARESTDDLIIFLKTKYRSGTKSRPQNNRSHLLRTQKVQNRCAGSRPIVTKGGATCARAARSPDASCLIVACAVAAGIQRRKRTPNQQRSTKSRPQMIIGVICFAHKKHKTGALGAARSSQKGAQRAHGPPAAPMHHA